GCPDRRNGGLEKTRDRRHDRPGGGGQDVLDSAGGRGDALWHLRGRPAPDRGYRVLPRRDDRNGGGRRPRGVYPRWHIPVPRGPAPGPAPAPRDAPQDTGDPPG